MMKLPDRPSGLPTWLNNMMKFSQPIKLVNEKQSMSLQDQAQSQAAGKVVPVNTVRSISSSTSQVIVVTSVFTLPQKPPSLRQTMSVRETQLKVEYQRKEVSVNTVRSISSGILQVIMVARVRWPQKPATRSRPPHSPQTPTSQRQNKISG